MGFGHRVLGAVAALALTASAVEAQLAPPTAPVNTEVEAAALAPGDEALLAAEPPAPIPPRDRIAAAWRAPASSLDSRVTRTRRAALTSGFWNLDAAAQAALVKADAADPLARARAAVRLAPDLPVAHMALASALWLHGDSPIAAVWSVIDALAAAFRHSEGTVWLLGSGLFVLAVSLIAAGLIATVATGIAAAAHAGHDLGHVVARSSPEFARVSLLSALLLVPLALGEGVFGLALAFLGVGVLYGSPRARVVLALAAVGAGLGAYPVAELAGRALSFFPSDAAATAAYSVASGSAAPKDITRLEAARKTDALATRALAMHARQRGRLGQADAYYQRLLEVRPGDASVANNAANVRLKLGHMESAFELYGRALEGSESAVVLFNLSQAYGQAFQVDDLNRTLGHAQAVDGDLVARLTALEGTKTDGFVADLPVPRAVLWQRLMQSPMGDGIAAELRRPVAPGHLGSDPTLFAGSFGVVWLLFSLIGMRHEPTRWCDRCGSRMCPRCDSANAEGELCGSCKRLFYQPEKTDRGLRTERLNALRDRQDRIDHMATATAVLVPGAAGLLSGRPVTTWLGAFCFAVAVACIVWRGGVVADPLILGPAAPLAFMAVAVAALLGHAGLAAAALAARRRERA